MTKQQIIEKLDTLSDAELQRVLPYLEADLNAIEGLDELHRHIQLGRNSAACEPLQDSSQLYDRLRQSL